MSSTNTDDHAANLAAIANDAQKKEQRAPHDGKYLEAGIMDALAIFLFALLARIAHNTPEFPFSWGGVAATAWPFLIGGAAGFGIIAITRKKALTIVPAGISVWLSCVIIGLIIWAIKEVKVPHWSFVLVATIMSALLILGWRGLAALSARFAAKRATKK